MKRTLVTSALIAAASSGALVNGASAAENPHQLADETLISLSGTAVETTPSTFLLDYGKGQITVEMDDWDWVDEEARGLIEGDQVTVYGEIDDDFPGKASIEASSVYVAPLGTYFYANSSDEEAIPVNEVVTFAVGSDVTVNGTVTEVSQLAGEFTLDYGVQKMTIETSQMPYNPVDDTGYQQIEVGDRISVSGYMEQDIVESMELVAEALVVTDKASS